MLSHTADGLREGACGRTSRPEPGCFKGWLTHAGTEGGIRKRHFALPAALLLVPFPAITLSIYLIRAPSLLSGCLLISAGAHKAEAMSSASGPRDEPLGVKLKRISNILCAITRQSFRAVGVQATDLPQNRSCSPAAQYDVPIVSQSGREAGVGTERVWLSGKNEGEEKQMHSQLFVKKKKKKSKPKRNNGTVIHKKPVMFSRESCGGGLWHKRHLSEVKDSQP